MAPPIYNINNTYLVHTRLETHEYSTQKLIISCYKREFICFMEGFALDLIQKN